MRRSKWAKHGCRYCANLVDVRPKRGLGSRTTVMACGLGLKRPAEGRSCKRFASMFGIEGER